MAIVQRLRPGVSPHTLTTIDTDYDPLPLFVVCTILGVEPGMRLPNARSISRQIHNVSGKQRWTFDQAKAWLYDQYDAENVVMFPEDEGFGYRYFVNPDLEF